MKATLDRTPWRMDYELRLGQSAGRHVVYASGISEDGQIQWTTADEGIVVPPFLVLRDDVLEAIARALGDVTQASDATVEALKDTRAVRDRLLSLVEKGWEQP